MSPHEKQKNNKIKNSTNAGPVAGQPTPPGQNQTRPYSLAKDTKRRLSNE
jgi:hypothetical protein